MYHFVTLTFPLCDYFIYRELTLVIFRFPNYSEESTISFIKYTFLSLRSDLEGSKRGLRLC